MEEENRPMDATAPDNGNSGAHCSKETHQVARAVDAGSSGQGLPYAPEAWPNPGDVWTWKVGRRVDQSGYWKDRSLWPPKRLKYLGPSFYSRASLVQCLRKEFTEAQVDAFFGSFVWRIPAAGYSQKESRSGGSEVNGCFKSEAATRWTGCKAGNTCCTEAGSIREKERSSALAIMPCDICCAETGFCRHCCCILCCKTVDWSHGGYSFVRCEAVKDEKYICEHVSHVECALNAYLAGKVGGSVDLDAQYFCRCCESKTDLINHVIKLIKTCESIDSREDTEKMLNVCYCILRGSEQERAKELQDHLAVAMVKLKHGMPLDEIWREGHSILAPAQGNSPRVGYAVTVLGAQETAKSRASADSLSIIEHFHENDTVSERARDDLQITSGHHDVSMKLEDGAKSSPAKTEEIPGRVRLPAR